MVFVVGFRPAGSPLADPGCQQASYTMLRLGIVTYMRPGHKIRLTGGRQRWSRGEAGLYERVLDFASRAYCGTTAVYSVARFILDYYYRTASNHTSIFFARRDISADHTPARWKPLLDSRRHRRTHLHLHLALSNYIVHSSSYFNNLQHLSAECRKEAHLCASVVLALPSTSTLPPASL